MNTYADTISFTAWCTIFTLIVVLFLPTAVVNLRV
jgi:hypothetical protein